MAYLPINLPDPQPLVLYTLAPACRIDQCVQDKVLRKEESYIAIREDRFSAVEREKRKCPGGIKESHFVVRFTFHPLGISYFTTNCGDECDQFKSLLHKVPCDGSVDLGCWRFISDLPLYAMSASGQVMVDSEIMYVV